MWILKVAMYCCIILLMDIIYRELIENTAWRVIRNFTPCNDCLFQFICPPISNYEYSLGCKSFCHVKNESNKK